MLGCEAAQHPCERTECMMDARLGGLVREWFKLSVPPNLAAELVKRPIRERHNV